MAIHDLAKAVLVKTILPTSSATTGTYKLLDTKGYSGVLINVLAGKHAATGTVDVTVAEPTTRGGGAELGVASQRMASTYHLGITDASFTQITTSNDVAHYSSWLDLGPRKRYISVRMVRANAATNTAVDILMFRPTYLPTTQENSLGFDGP
jgi:hypothetical protein